MSRRTLIALVGALAAAAATVLGAAPADAHPSRHHADRANLVFVQTNDPAGNAVAVYRQRHSGALDAVQTVPTGGLGGRLEGAVTDPLASQGSLLYDADHAVLLAVNAGSRSVSVFGVHGDRIHLRQVVRSGGAFPVGLARHGDLVYVVNAGNAGSIKGFEVQHGLLRALRGSWRSLHLSPVTGPTQFVNTPGQVAFSPSGRQLVVTTKANGSTIDVFAVRDSGRPSPTFVANPSSTPVPFALVFDRAHRLVVAEAGTSALTTYRLHHDGTVEALSSVVNGQQALCWLVRDGRLAFGSNTGSGTVTSYRAGPAGAYSVLANTPVDSGPIDTALSRDGRFLYVESGGAGTVTAMRVGQDGSLTAVGSVSDLGGLEGIAVR